ncbi:uncharacterized protein HKW66_Vig0129020 [Vigna angularis]|uniref:Retrotransposon gag domain-containing protein n=1 Tax=Phaseolus angularis TaxID=3914 RepID=A0A8T0K2J5_PHAAN|nr:uncharacterized protein HKW66_Vig0129020 [Vigna angularis]
MCSPLPRAPSLVTAPKIAAFPNAPKRHSNVARLRALSAVRFADVSVSNSLSRKETCPIFGIDDSRVEKTSANVTVLAECATLSAFAGCATIKVEDYQTPSSSVDKDGEASIQLDSPTPKVKKEIHEVDDLDHIVLKERLRMLLTGASFLVKWGHIAGVVERLTSSTKHQEAQDSIAMDGRDEAYGWTNRLEWYFRLKGVSEEERMKAVMVALEGKALNWFQWWETCHPHPTWETFKDAVQFEQYAAFMKGMQQDYLVGIFLNGLKEDIRAEVKLYEPHNLAELMIKAQMVEEKVRVTTKGTLSVCNFKDKVKLHGGVLIGRVKSLVLSNNQKLKLPGLSNTVLESSNGGLLETIMEETLKNGDDQINSANGKAAVDYLGRISIVLPNVKHEREVHNENDDDQVDHMKLIDRLNFLKSGTDSSLHISTGYSSLKKIRPFCSLSSPIFSKSTKPSSINCRRKRKKTATDSVQEALEEDAPGLLQVLLDKGVLVDEIKLYGEEENDETLDESFGEDSFSELEAVMAKISSQRHTFLKFPLTRGSKTSRASYCFACLFSLVEQTRYLKFRKWPVEWGWCRDLQSFIFVFERHNRIVLERPEYGYATYFFELVESLPVQWQVKRLVIAMKLTTCSRISIIENKELVVGEDLSEGEAKVLMEFGWMPSTGLGTMLNYCDRVVHDRKNEEFSSEWRSKIGKLLVDGYKGGTKVKPNVPIKDSQSPVIDSSCSRPMSD